MTEIFILVTGAALFGGGIVMGYITGRDAGRAEHKGGSDGRDD